MLPKSGNGIPKKKLQNVLKMSDIEWKTPKKFIAKLSQEVQLSIGTCRTILKKDYIHIKFKFMKSVPLIKVDKPSTVNEFLDNLDNNDVPDKCFFTDEAWFHPSGSWSSKTPHEFVKKPLHSQKKCFVSGVKATKHWARVF
ncbi:hypothetical protein Trydic_g19131 [Trypoxylus dichotomus]